MGMFKDEKRGAAGVAKLVGAGRLMFGGGWLEWKSNGGQSGGRWLVLPASAQFGFGLLLVRRRRVWKLSKDDHRRWRRVLFFGVSIVALISSEGPARG
jgi:hypothetical protein